MTNEPRKIGPKTFKVGYIIDIPMRPRMRVSEVSVGILNYVKASPLGLAKDSVYLIFDTKHNRYGITEDFENVEWIFSDFTVSEPVHAYRDDPLKF